MYLIINKLSIGITLACILHSYFIASYHVEAHPENCRTEFPEK